MVNTIVTEWIRQVVGDDAARLGVGVEIRNFLAIFYADNGLIQARYPERLQSSFTILVELFERVGLRINTSKTKVMVCVPGQIRTHLTEGVYNNSREGLISRDNWLNHRVECDICKKDLAASSLTSHLETQHDVYRSFVLNRDLMEDREPRVCTATFSHATNQFFCPVRGGGTLKLGC